METRYVIRKTPAATPLRLLCALMLGAGASGCIQVETRVKLHQDASATVTERLRLSRRLLDLAGKDKGQLLKLLSREAALRRMKKMGTNIKLVRHELRDAPGASKESLTEFKVAHIDDFKYVSPWPHLLDYPENNALKFKLVPLYTCGSSSGQAWAGQMRVQVTHTKRVKRRDYRKDAERKKPSPIQEQVLRELGPVFRDMLKGLHLRFTFEAYCPLVPSSGSPGIRNLRAGAREVDLLNFSDKNLDSWGGEFLRNEEIMLELLRFSFDRENVYRHVKDYTRNHTLPVLMSRGGGRTYIFIRPSRYLFDKHFKGKTISWRPWRRVPQEEAADFNKIGWKPRATKPASSPGAEKKTPPPTRGRKSKAKK
jgi:hypothetical protein